MQIFRPGKIGGGRALNKKNIKQKRRFQAGGTWIGGRSTVPKKTRTDFTWEEPEKKARERRFQVPKKTRTDFSWEGPARGQGRSGPRGSTELWRDGGDSVSYVFYQSDFRKQAFRRRVPKA